MSKNPTERENRGGAGPRALAQSLAKIAKPILGRQGFGAIDIVADWPAIVGPMLAEETCPVKIVYPRGERGDGTLHLKVANGALAIELQHLAPLILERINRCSGYRAVARIALTQGPVPKRERPKRAKPRSLTAEEEDRLARQLAGVENPEMRAILANLGRAILAKG